MTPILVLVGLLVLCLLGLLASNLLLTGDTRKRVQFWIRFLFMMAIPISEVLSVNGVIPPIFEQISFPVFAFGGAILMFIAFIVTDFVTYTKERTAEAAKDAIQSAIVTQAFMLFVIVMILLDSRRM